MVEYKVFLGSRSGVFEREFDAGSMTRYTIADVLPGRTYYPALRAYDARGRLSKPTREASITLPLPTATPSVTPTALPSATPTAATPTTMSSPDASASPSATATPSPNPNPDRDGNAPGERGGNGDDDTHGNADQ